MFRRIINNLAVNPSSLNQFVFYSKRLKKERSIRTIGVSLMILSLFVQLFAAAIPAEKSFANGDNDIVKTKIRNLDHLVSICKTDAKVRSIYARFGANCDQIATAKQKTINANGANYWSIGYSPLSQYNISSDEWGEVAVKVGSENIFQRPLRAWGPHNYVAYEFKANGKTYWILQDCGNLVTIGAYSKPPSLEVHKQLITPKQVQVGDTVKYRITYRNPVLESVAVDFRLRDLLNPNLELVGMDGRNGFVDGDPVIDLKGLGGSTTFREITLAAKVKTRPADGKICNVVRVSADVVGRVESKEDVCVTVVKPPTPPPVTPTTPAPTPPTTPATPTTPVTPKCAVPGKTDLPVDSPLCKHDAPAGICIASTGFLAGSNKDFKVSTVSSVEGTTKVRKYTYIMDGDTANKREVTSSSLTNEQTYNGLKPGTHKVAVTVDFTNEVGQSASDSCTAEITVAENARVTQSKSVSKDGADMNGKKVSSGDVLKFNLTTRNVTATEYKNFAGEDFFGDVLNYADIVDVSELTKQGMSLGQDKVIRWTTPSIAGNSEEVKTITVKVKPKIPTTNQSSNISSDFDCIIDNKYGNQVTMSVDCPVIKTIETTTGKLPDTGPGTAALIVFGVTVMAGYFAARARLMAKEADIIRKMNQHSHVGA